MVPTHGIKVVGAFHEPTVWSPGFSRSGPPEGGTPNRPDDPDGFIVPMHGRKAERAFHEPQDASLANEQVAHLGFMVPMHSNNRKRALHEPGTDQPTPDPSQEG